MTRRIGDRYETGLLWHDNYTEFSNSYPMAVKGVTLAKRLKKDSEAYVKVRSMVADNIDEGYKLYTAMALEQLALECCKVGHC